MLVVPMCRYACSMPQYFQFTCSDTDATLKFHCSGALLAFALAIFDATLKIRNGHILDATLQTHAGALHAALEVEMLTCSTCTGKFDKAIMLGD